MFNVPYPIGFLQQQSQPNPTHIEYIIIVVENFLHCYWSIAYPI